MFNLKSFQRDVGNFSSEVNLEYYRNWSGLKEDLNLTKIYDKYRHLFDRNNVTRIKELRMRETKSGEGERKLRYLQAFATEEVLQNYVREFTDRRESVEAREVVKIDGEEIPFRMAEVRCLNEDNRKKRAQLFHARNTVIVEKLNPILWERMERLWSIARELGYANYLELFRDTKNINFEELNNAMRYFVERTASLYTDKMGEAIRRALGVDLSEAEKHDIAFFFRAKEFDSHFAKEKTLEVLDETLKGIGFDILKNKNIRIDLEERPKKSPRAFTAPVKVPSDVRLVVMPVGGQDDYGAILHEAGHTVHFASVDPKLPIEYKWLGDISVSETYAFLLEYLTLNGIWLKENLGFRELGKYLDFAYLYKLYFLRRYAGKISYELLIHSGRAINNMGEKYKEKLEETLKFKHPKAHYLTDLDDGFYSAQYLRAWIFEGQLRSKLVEKFGEKWFKNQGAGKFLSELWSTGQKHDVVELAQTIGFNGLDVKPILSEIQEHFA